MRTLLLAAAAACLAACSNAALPQTASAEPAARAEPAENEAIAVFAGGCFWCIEAELEEVPGVRTVVSGYTGGTTPDPTYQRMGDHAEAVEVIYDPAVVSYDQLLEVFWSNIDPTDEGVSSMTGAASIAPPSMCSTTRRPLPPAPHSKPTPNA